MRLRLAMACGVLLSAACATSQEIKRPGGDREFLIACGSGSGWDVCYRKANEVWPLRLLDSERRGWLQQKGTSHRVLGGTRALKVTPLPIQAPG